MSASPGQIAAAVFLPPLGVYLARGQGRDFAIACGLTVLGFLPGAAFALWTVLRSAPRVAAAAGPDLAQRGVTTPA